MSVNNVMPDEQLPDWMKRAQRPVDWGALLAIIIGLLAAFSYIAQPSLPAGNALEHHAIRIDDYAQAFDEGLLYTRWSPYALHGYGAPIAHYYPPGIAYTGGLIRYLFTNDTLLAVRALIIASLMIASGMMYAFVKQAMGAVAGLLSSALYVFSPVVMVSVPFIEGDLPLVAGIALLPTLLWAVSRLLRRNLPLDFVLIAVSSALIVVTTPRFIPFVVLVVGVFSLVFIIQQRPWQRVLVIVGAMLTGGLLAAFYWLPALLEQNLVAWYPSFMGARVHYVDWAALISIPQPIDSGLMLPMPLYSLGPVIAISAAVGGMLTAIHKQHVSLVWLHLLLGVGCSVAVVFMPDMPIMPTLIIGIFSLSLAAGSIGSYHYHWAWQGIALGTMLFAMVSTLTLWSLPEPTITLVEPTITQRLAYEDSGYGIAGLPHGLALPSVMSPEVAQRDAFAFPEATVENTENNTLNRTSDLPTSLSLIANRVYTQSFIAFGTQERTIIIDRAYFAGWDAIAQNSTDALIDFTPLADDGRQRVIVRPNDLETTFTVRLGLTPLRSAAWVVSLVGALLMSIAWWWRWHTMPTDYDNSRLLIPWQLYTAIGILICVLTLRLYVDFLPDTWATRPPQDSLINAVSVRNNIDRRFELVAYEMPRTTITSGETLAFTTYWGIIFDVDAQYVLRLRLTDMQGNTVLNMGRVLHPGYLPTSRWLPGVPIAQQHRLTVPDTLSNGRYRLRFDVYACAAQCDVNTVTNETSEGAITIPDVLIVE